MTSYLWRCSSWPCSVTPSGSEPHVEFAGARHTGNLFVLVVGDSREGRKGTSLSAVAKLFAEAPLGPQGPVMPGAGSRLLESCEQLKDERPGPEPEPWFPELVINTIKVKIADGAPEHVGNDRASSPGGARFSRPIFRAALPAGQVRLRLVRAGRFPELAVLVRVISRHVPSVNTVLRPATIASVARSCVPFYLSQLGSFLRA